MKLNIKPFIASLYLGLTLSATEVEAMTLQDAVIETMDEYNQNGRLDHWVIYHNEDEFMPHIVDLKENNDSIDFRDYVLVNGRGSESSTGDGNKTIKYEDELMAVVGVKSGANYPYALARVDENKDLSEVVGWFKEENLKSCDVLYRDQKKADIERTIRYVKLIGLEYDENNAIKSAVFYGAKEDEGIVWYEKGLSFIPDREIGLGSIDLDHYEVLLLDIDAACLNYQANERISYESDDYKLVSCEGDKYTYVNDLGEEKDFWFDSYRGILFDDNICVEQVSNTDKNLSKKYGIINN